MSQGSTVARSTRSTKQEDEGAAESVVILRQPAGRVASTAALPEVEPDAGSALDAVLAELGSVDDARVMVYRVDKGGAMQYVATMTPEEVQGEASLLESIRQEFGGGSYRVHVRNGAGLLANRRVDIAERKLPAADGGLSAISALMDRQQQQFERILQAIAPARPSAAESEDAMLGRLKLMSEILRPAQAAGGAGGLSGADGAKLFADALTQGIKLGKSMHQPEGGATGTDAIVQALATFAPVIADAARSRQLPAPRAAVAPAAPRPAAAAAPAPAPAASAAAESEAEEDQAQQLRELLSVVLRAARADSDPAIYAGMVMDQVGDDSLTLMLEQEDPLGMLEQFEPAIGTHREWFERLLAEIKEAINAAPDDAAIPADGAPIGPGGRAPNAADHAAAG